MRFLVSPQSWYRIYWTAMGIAFMAVNYFVVREAVTAAIVKAATVLGWSK